MIQIWNHTIVLFAFFLFLSGHSQICYFFFYLFSKKKLMPNVFYKPLS